MSGGGVKNSVKILAGIRKQPFLKVFGITFNNHNFDKTCRHRINMKFCTVFLQFGTARAYLSRLSLFWRNISVGILMKSIFHTNNK